MGKLYTQDGWVNWDYIVRQTKAFCMVVGARGTGKTFGLMRWLLHQRRPFLYVRRLKSQLDICATIDANPFRAINDADKDTIRPFRKNGMIRFCRTQVDDKGKEYPTGDPVAIGVALSTFQSMRGMDFSNINTIVFDEAVPNIGQKPIKEEFSAFLNLYESVNRNRELTGAQPVQCFLLGNANKLSNPYYTGWQFMRTALHMLDGHQQMWRSEDGSRIMLLLRDSPISAKKAETSLYKNATNDFLTMATDNAFRVDPSRIKSLPLSQCRYVRSVGELGIYALKDSSCYYISATTRKQNSTPGYGIYLQRFQAEYYFLRLSYMLNHILFESYEIQLIFRQYLEIM